MDFSSFHGIIILSAHCTVRTKKFHYIKVRKGLVLAERFFGSCKAINIPYFLYLIQIFGKSHVETRNHHHHHSMNFETPPAPTTKFLLPSKFSSNSCDKDKNENPLQVCKRKYFRFYNAHAHDKSSEVISYHIHWMIQQRK